MVAEGAAYRSVSADTAAFQSLTVNDVDVGAKLSTPTFDFTSQYVKIGEFADDISQGESAVAIGWFAGSITQKSEAVAMGTRAGVGVQ